MAWACRHPRLRGDDREGNLFRSSPGGASGYFVPPALRAAPAKSPATNTLRVSVRLVTEP